MLLEWVECVTLDTSRDISLIKDDVSKFTETWAVRYGIVIKETSPLLNDIGILCCCCTELSVLHLVSELSTSLVKCQLTANSS